MRKQIVQVNHCHQSEMINMQEIKRQTQTKRRLCLVREHLWIGNKVYKIYIHKVF